MSATSPATARVRARRFTGRGRKLVLTLHIVSGVALLGLSAGLTVAAIHAGGLDDPQRAHAVYELMHLLTISLDIPLALTALVTGVVLATSGRWGLLGYWWVTTQVALLLGVIVIGAAVTGGSVDTLLDVTEHSAPSASAARWTLPVATAVQAAMLLTASVLSVFRPGGRIRQHVDSAVAAPTSE